MLTRKAFQYRLYPTKAQEQHLIFVLRRCRHLSNSALEERRAHAPDAAHRPWLHSTGG